MDSHKDQRVRRVFFLFQKRFRGPSLCGGKPLKVKLCKGKSARVSAVMTAEGPGMDVTRHPGLNGSMREGIARVRDSGRAGVGHQRDVFPFQQAFQQLWRHPGFVYGMESHLRL